jgi:hypothetical protein
LYKFKGYLLNACHSCVILCNEYNNIGTFISLNQGKAFIERKKYIARCYYDSEIINRKIFKSEHIWHEKCK